MELQSAYNKEQLRWQARDANKVPFSSSSSLDELQTALLGARVGLTDAEHAAGEWGVQHRASGSDMNLEVFPLHEPTVVDQEGNRLDMSSGEIEIGKVAHLREMTLRRLSGTFPCVSRGVFPSSPESLPARQVGVRGLLRDAAWQRRERDLRGLLRYGVAGRDPHGRRRHPAALSRVLRRG